MSIKYLGDILAKECAEMQDVKAVGHVPGVTAMFNALCARAEANGLELVVRPKRAEGVEDKLAFVVPLNPSAFDNSIQYEAKLLDRGWVLLGSGFYSSVFINDKYPDKVIKVARSTERLDDWPVFAAYAQSVNSPHLIKVYNIKRHNGFYVALMERLVCNAAEYSRHTEELPGDIEMMRSIGDAVIDRHGFNRQIIRKEGDITDIENNARVRYIRSKVPKLLSTLRLLGMRNLINDLHAANFGFRKDGTIVIFDPCEQITNKKLKSKYAVDKSWKAAVA
jgi:hypothetical protein